MAGNIKGIVVEIGADTSALQKALTKINSISSGLSKELRDVNNLLKLDPSNTVAVSQKQEILAEKLKITSQRLEELEITQEIALEEMAKGTEISQENYRALEREIEKTKIELNKLNAENSNWTKMGNSLVTFGDKLTNISSKIENLGSNLTNKVTMPILAISSAIGITLVKSAMDFETAFTGVTKTVDGTDEQLQKIKKGIKEMAEVIPSSTTEIAAVAEAAGQLGIQTDNILNFTKVMIDLGNSTNLSATEAASALAKFANITKMSANDYSRLGSVIVDLGNNFATTEKDIVDMATKLASTGELTGLTEAQIMALATAMSSVGIEAEAGGSAMSKLLKRIQVAVETGSEELKSFAQVSGMTADEFKQAFEKDAVNALSAFLGGLNDTTRNGKSAIAILDDMDITEVRLSNTVLALASNSDLLNDAVNTANKAWSENTALSTEADKRYETLASKVEMTKNHLINMATDMGDKLTPTISEVLDKINELIDSFSGLSEEEIKNIIQIAAMVAAIGPAITIIGKLGTATGNTITTIGNFSKAIGNIKNGVTEAEGQVGLFMKAISALTSPIGLVTAGIVALTTATVLYAKKQAEEIYGLDGVTASVNKQKESWEKLKQARDEQLEDSVSEINRLENLRNELDAITDANGKVKEGYQNRAKVIVNELNSALGTEISLNGDVIKNYKDMQTEISKLIEKKKAEALLNAYQKEYTEALKNQAKATENLVSLKQQLKEKISELVNANGKERAEIQLSISAISHQIKEESEQISQYGYTIQNYEALQEACVSGSAEALEKATEQMGVSWERAKTQVSDSLTEQIKYEQDYLIALKSALKDAETSHDESQAYIIKKQIESSETRLKNLKDELATTETLNTDTQKFLLDSQKDTNQKTLNEQIQSANERMRNLNTELADTKKLNSETQDYLTKLQKDSNYIRLNEQIQSTNEKMRNLNTELTDTKQLNTDTQEYLTKLQKDSNRTRLDEQNQTKATRLKELTDEITTTKNLNVETQDYLTKLQKDSNQTRKDEQSQTKKTMLEALENGLNDAKNKYSDTQKNITDEQEKSKNTRLSNLQGELNNTSSMINNNTSIQDASSNLASRTTNNFRNNNRISQEMQSEINATANVENNDRSVGDGASRLAGEVNRNFNNNVNGHQWGADLSNNISNGIISTIGSVASAAARVASTIASYLHHSVPDKGPLADEMNYMPDMIKNLTETLLQASPQLEEAAADVAEKLSDNLNLGNLGTGFSQNVINGTRTIFTTPQIVFNVQKMDDDNLEQCFNYVNRRLGSNY